MRHLVGLALAGMLAAGGCGSGEPASGDARRAEMAGIVDAVKAAVPADRMGDVTWYEPDNLYEYIDGAAAEYVDSGFQRLVHTEWQPRDARGNAYVELDIYDMGTPEGSLDIICDSRTEQTAYLAIGNECHDVGELLELRVGRYYVKIVPRRDVPSMKPLARSLAEAVAKAAPAGPPDEELVAPLPSSNMVPHTAAYKTKDFLGRDSLKAVREATYNVQGKKVRLFVMDAKDPDKAKEALLDWRESLPPQPVGAPEVPNMLSYHDEFIGDIAATCKGKWVAGAIGDPAAAKPLLQSLLKRLD